MRLSLRGNSASGIKSNECNISAVFCIDSQSDNIALYWFCKSLLYCGFCSLLMRNGMIASSETGIMLLKLIAPRRPPSILRKSLLVCAANTRDFSRVDTAARPKNINTSSEQKIK